MKKTVTIISAVLLFVICLSFCSCDLTSSRDKTVNPIDFGKKYVLNSDEYEDLYFVFNDDYTGYYEARYDRSSGDRVSGRVDFVWREASDGAVYLFKVDTRYYDDHTAKGSIAVTAQPIYFSEDFFTYIKHNSSGAAIYRYIKEGSELDKLLND